MNLENVIIFGNKMEACNKKFSINNSLNHSISRSKNNFNPQLSIQKEPGFTQDSTFAISTDFNIYESHSSHHIS